MRRTPLDPPAAFVTRFIPRADRDAVVGDLIEEASWRGLRGARRSWWLAGQCATIAAGLTVDRARALVSVHAAREVAAGVAIDSGLALRAHWPRPRTLVARALLFAGTVATLALSAGVLVGALLTAAGLR